MITGETFHPIRWAVCVVVGLPLLLGILAAVTTLTGQSDSSRALLRALKYVVMMELLFAIVAATIGYIHEAANRRSDRETYRPPGKLVDVGGYRLHLYCTGEGGPTVLLEFGLDGSYLDWYRVQPHVARFARVCSYDRAGYGWSDPSPRPRVPSVMSEELHLLLMNAGEKPPYIFVGHSMGSFDALMYAHRYPGEVAGVVLVDGAHPDELLPFYFQKKLWLRMMQITMPFGLPRWRAWCGIGAPEIAGMKRAIGCQSHVYATHYAQWEAFPRSAGEVRNLGSLGNVPLIVISRDPNRTSKSEDVVSAQREHHWSTLQQRLMELSKQSTHISAQGSGHSIPVERPDVIVDAIREMVTRLRTTPSSGNSE
jgi:pimeloyl-ACP methyl ester carboxylesterase